MFCLTRSKATCPFKAKSHIFGSILMKCSSIIDNASMLNFWSSAIKILFNLKSLFTFDFKLTIYSSIFPSTGYLINPGTF